jgi:hypothetical protein
MAQKMSRTDQPDGMDFGGTKRGGGGHIRKNPLLA